MEVWNKFLEFESNIGDLAGVIKVERRRAQVGFQGWGRKGMMC
jgi:cleavage stimulation factor subunit 3